MNLENGEMTPRLKKTRTLMKMEEVCELTGVRPYVLRFWESEFPEIVPVLGESGNKFYSSGDIEIIKLIKKLLFDEKCSIEKARLKMMEMAKVQENEVLVEDVDRKEEVLSLQQKEGLLLAKTKLEGLLQSIDHFYQFLKERESLRR